MGVSLKTDSALCLGVTPLARKSLLTDLSEVCKVCEVANPVIAKLQPVMVTQEICDRVKCGQIIGDACRALRISQKALALELGMKAPYINDLLQGRRNWTVERFDQAKAAMERLLDL